jgi:hypothetical protein
MGYHLVETEIRKLGCCVTVYLLSVLTRVNENKVFTVHCMKACGDVDV